VAPTCLEWLGGPRGVSCCAKKVNDEGTLVLLECLKDPRIPYGRNVNRALPIRPLDRDLADARSAHAGLVVALEPPSASAASASAPVVLRPPLWGGVWRPAYVLRGPAQHGCTRRAYPLGGSSGKISCLKGPSGPPLAPLPLFTGEEYAQLGTSRPVNPAE